MVHTLLYRNQEKLISFLINFQTERTDDGQFNDEKQYLIKQIRDLKPLPNCSSTAQVTSSATQPHD